jgi:hypothetical protein
MKLGYDSQRQTTLPGLVRVSVLWIQQAYNAWLRASGSGAAPIAADGVWGPQTNGAVIAMVSAMDPAALTSIVAPAGPGRTLSIPTSIEGRLVGLEVGGSGPAISPARPRPPADTGGGTPLVEIPPTPPITAGPEGWQIALGVAALLTSAAVVYATLTITPAR